MKPISYSAVLAALVLAITSVTWAQSQFYPENTNSWQTASQNTAPTIAVQTNAQAPQGHFYAESTNAWGAPDDAAPAPVVHYGKTGKLHLKSAINVAGGTLKPGNYQVRMAETPDEHYVEFSKTVINYFAEEGLSPYEQKVVAEIPCTMEQMNAAVARTELLPKRDNAVARLEIRGENVVHLV